MVSQSIKEPVFIALLLIIFELRASRLLRAWLFGLGDLLIGHEQTRARRIDTHHAHGAPLSTARPCLERAPPSSAIAIAIAMQKERSLCQPMPARAPSRSRDPLTHTVRTLHLSCIGARAGPCGRVSSRGESVRAGRHARFQTVPRSTRKSE